VWSVKRADCAAVVIMVGDGYEARTCCGGQQVVAVVAMTKWMSLEGYEMFREGKGGVGIRR
jgi:hypothetical protein